MPDRNRPDRNGDAEKNIALLIDADNASPDHLDEVLLVLGELGTINVRRAYGNWAKASLKGWEKLTGLHSIIPGVSTTEGAIAGAVLGGVLGAVVKGRQYYRDTRGYCYYVDQYGRPVYDYNVRC